MTERRYDYVIAGAGSAGCVLARRLTEDPCTTVLLLEAGGADRDPLIHVPIGLGKMWQERRHDWGFVTESEPGLGGRAVDLPRGKVLGGSSSINALLYVRGHRGDYDRWAQAGLADWSYEKVLPYFKRSERWCGGGNAWRGGEGPLGTRFTDLTDPLCAAVIAAGRQAGFAVSEDLNAEVQEGFGMAQSTIAGGRRASSARAYLKPAMRRPNLTVRTGAHAERILIEANKALGVEYLHRGRRARALAEREVLVCAGAINSPQLLMLSGIGASDELKRLGIEPVVHLPGVGANLQDHVFVGVGNLRKGTSPLYRSLRYDRIALAMLRAYFFGTGQATNPPGGAMGFIKTAPGPVPDIQFGFRGIARDAAPWWPLVGPAWREAFFLLVVLLHPASRGRIALASNDPAVPVRIRANYLQAPGDAQTLLAGVRVARRVLAQEALEKFRSEEIAPGSKLGSDSELLQYIRSVGSTLHHAAGTCRMGADDSAVLDAEFRVRGLERLRVVDASAMPDLVSGNINACVLMMAERASDMIRGLAA